MRRCGEKLAKLRERILNGEDFAGIASATSEDPGSAPDGGDLGWTGPGTFVPEFDKAIADLKVNEISQPFKTRYGWHIVQMLGTRTYDSTDDVRRQKAFAAIRESKADEETELWLRRLRDEAFVEDQDVGTAVPTAHRRHLGRTRRHRARCLRALAQSDWRADLVVAGDAIAARRRPRRRSALPLASGDSTTRPGPPPVIAPGTLKVLHVPTRTAGDAPAELDPRNAAYVIEMLDRACDGCMNGEFAAMVTAPVQKSTLMDAGFAFTGHTEYLAGAHARGAAGHDAAETRHAAASRWSRPTCRSPTCRAPSPRSGCARR